jgi:hypothetical protein
MIKLKNREYLLIEAGDLDIFGWEYKAIIDVFYLYLLAIVLGISTGAFIVIVNKRGPNRRKKKSKEIEKIPRGGDTPDDDLYYLKAKEEFHKFLYQQLYHPIDNASCFPKSGFSKVMNQKTARKLYDSLKTSVKKSLQKKSLPIVVTAGTAILAHKVANVKSLTLGFPVASWPITISTALGSNLNLLFINVVRSGIVAMDTIIFINFIYNVMTTLGLSLRQFIAIYQLKEKAKGLLFAILVNYAGLLLQKRYCANFIAPVADTSIELVIRQPDTILLPDSSNGIYVVSSSSSLKLVLKDRDRDQCTLDVKDILVNWRTSNHKDFQNYLENQNQKCDQNQIVEIEPLSLKDFDIKTFKGNINSEYWEILQKESYNEEKKVNKMLLDSSVEVEVVKDFPKPTPKRDLNCEKEAYEKTFEGRLETSLGDLEEPSEMPIPIQIECSQNKSNRKSKSVPLKKRTGTLADLKDKTREIDETSTIPKMFEPKEASRILNQNQK